MKQAYKHSSHEVLKALSSSAEGLTHSEAKQRLDKYGMNKLKEAEKPSLFQRFLAQLKDPMLIILLFLRSFRSTLVIAFSMPISILITLVCMSIGGLTLNVMTMTGLILGIGILGMTLCAVPSIKRKDGTIQRNGISCRQTTYTLHLGNGKINYKITTGSGFN